MGFEGWNWGRPSAKPLLLQNHRIFFCFLFCFDLVSTQVPHPWLPTWRTFWEDVGSSWDTLGFWRRSGGLCLAPGGGPLRSCGGVLGHSGWLGELWKALSGSWQGSLEALRALWDSGKLPGLLRSAWESSEALARICRAGEAMKALQWSHAVSIRFLAQ